MLSRRVAISLPWDKVHTIVALAGFLWIAITFAAIPGHAQEAPAAKAAQSDTAKPPAKNQAELETAFAKLLSGATLEGSYTSTEGGRAPDQLKRDKYTLGEVKKLDGNLWLIQARIEYKDSKAMLPLPLPIEWAGDTPVIVVNDVTIPGMGTFSARVMFFDGHYMGYWKHDNHGGHLFGVVHPAKTPAQE
jgi:hypothetical protein